MVSATTTDEEQMSGEVSRLAAALANANDDPFVAIVAATRLAIAITDPRQDDNPIIFTNDSFARLTGYTAEEVVGRNCRFLQGADTDPSTVAAIRAAVAARKPIEIDVRNYRKDGTPFWNRLAIAPVFDAAGQATFFFASQTDVTSARARTETLSRDNADLTVEVAERLEALRLSETRLRFATEVAAIGVWELSLPDLILTGTPTVNAVYGLPSGPPDHRAIRAAIHPDDAPRITAALDGAITRGESYHVVYRIQRADGSTGWIEGHGEVDLAPDGKAHRLRGVAQDVTARRAGEARLELSEESLRLATDAAEVGTWDLDLTTDTLTWTDRTRAMFGIANGTPVTLDDFYAGLHPDDLAATTAAFAAVLDPAVRAAYDVEFRTVGRDDGTVRWVAARGRGLFRGDRCVRAIGSVIDISRSRRAAERKAFLLKLSDKLRALYDAHAIKGTAMTALGRELRANRVGYGTVLDNGTHMLVENGYVDGCTPTDGVWAIADFGEALVTDADAGFTTAVTDTANDDRIGAELYAQTYAPIDVAAFLVAPLIRDGRHRASLFVNRTVATTWSDDDIALTEEVAARTWEAVERARAEAAVHRLNTTLEQRVEQAVAERDAIWRESRDMLLVIGIDGVIEAVNPAWTLTLGYSAADLIGHNYIEFLVADDIPASNAALGIAMAEPLRGFENRYRHADGSVREFAWTAAEANGKLYCIARDVTAEKAAARDLILTQEALRQAQKMEAVGQLTGGVAHDFNNMLAIVLGSLDLLGRRLSDDDARARRYLEAATDGAKRAATLTQRLLAFSRQQPLQPEPSNINRLVTGMSDLLRGSLGAGIQLETVLAGGLWLVNIDPNQLENVILNLGINARDAMNGEGKVTIETHNCELDDRYVAAEIGVTAGHYVMVAVTDEGTGMPSEIIDKAFDPFFTTKATGQGTGLGLSQAYGFVKQSGGHVKLYSEVGVGTTVKLYLPRLIGGTATTQATVADPPPVGGDERELILVVDDETGVRMITVESLRELGYRVIEADGAAGAMRLLTDNPDVALLFTDIVMPETNGARLAEAARAFRPGLKVLFTTGYTRNAVVHNGVVDAGVDLIGKPFTFEALAAKVRSVLDGG
jgi:PAS domain S-box-containing protein